MSLIKYEELKLDQIVKDKNGNIGIVVNIPNIHNIEVDYGLNGVGGKGLFCLEKSCEFYDELFSV